MKFEVEFLDKYKIFHQHKDIVGLGAVESFVELPTRQFIHDIEIETIFPFSQVRFFKSDALLGILCAIAKTDWGFAIKEDYEIYLNDVKIENLKLEEMDVYEKIIQNDNVITIRHLTNGNVMYFKQLLLYPLYCDKARTTKFIEDCLKSTKR